MAWAIICLGDWFPNPSCGLPGIQVRRAASSFLLGLAPVRGCLAADITTCAGSLLHYLFTITAKSEDSEAVCFCGPVRQITLPRELPGDTLCGVRTFLKRGCLLRSPDQPG